MRFVMTRKHRRNLRMVYFSESGRAQGRREVNVIF